MCITNVWLIFSLLLVYTTTPDTSARNEFKRRVTKEDLIRIQKFIKIFINGLFKLIALINTRLGRQSLESNFDQYLFELNCNFNHILHL